MYNSLSNTRPFSRMSAGAAAFICALAVGASVTSCASDNASSGMSQSMVMHADYPYYGSVAAAVDKASLIVVGSYVESYNQPVNPKIDVTAGDPDTNPHYGLDPDGIDESELAVPTVVSVIDVENVLKGERTGIGDTVKVSQPGELVDGAPVMAEESVAFSKVAHANPGAKCLLLLADSTTDVHAPINPQEGILILNPDGSVHGVQRSEITDRTIDEYKNAVID